MWIAVTLDPDEGLHGPSAIGQVFALLDQYAVYHKITGYVAEEKPCRENAQQERNCDDKQTLPRRGNCQ